MIERLKPVGALNDDWRAGFEDVRDRQLEAGMAASPKQRIEMLEALMAFALKAGTLTKEET